MIKNAIFSRAVALYSIRKEIISSKNIILNKLIFEAYIRKTFFSFNFCCLYFDAKQLYKTLFILLIILFVNYNQKKKSPAYRNFFKLSAKLTEVCFRDIILLFWAFSSAK